MRIRVLEHWRQLYSSIHQRSYESNDLLTAGVARLRLSETYAQIDIWQRELKYLDEQQREQKYLDDLAKL